MNYSKIGIQLRLARERKGLSYDQIFEVTRIQPSILKDIEEGTANLAPVLLKSFIKTYCRILGLDFEKMVAMAESQEMKKREESDKAKNEQDKKSKMSYAKKLQYVIPIFSFVVIFQLIRFLDLPSNPFKESSQLSSEETKADEETLGDSDLIRSEEGENIQKDMDSEASQHEPAFISWSLFEKIKRSVFKHEILIRSSNKLNIYFKSDNRITVNKTLIPFVWFYIKAQQNLYLRFDDKKGEIQVFYNGKQIDLGSNSFFERKFE